MIQRCLIIADDLTGGADTGVHFSQRGLQTLFLSSGKHDGLDLSGYGNCDALVVNTESRGMPPKPAFSAAASVLKTYGKALFPIIYKKIDSSLRGNIGSEIDAVLQGSELPMAFVAPSLPEQNRTLVGGIMMIAGIPIALTEMACDAISPVRESYAPKLIRRQSRHRVAGIDLTRVAAGGGPLKKAVLQARDKGARIVVFDAVRREDLAHIADIALEMDTIPLLAGSAGLARELAVRLSRDREGIFSAPGTAAGTCNHLFVVSGSASAVTHRQLHKLEAHPRVSSFALPAAFLQNGAPGDRGPAGEFRRQVARALEQGHAVLKMSEERVFPDNCAGPPIHARITGALSSIARAVIRDFAAERGVGKLALVLTGGQTAISVLNLLGVKGLEIQGEILGGIVKSRVHGGGLEGLEVITKAGAFGEENALEIVLEAACTRPVPPDIPGRL